MSADCWNRVREDLEQRGILPNDSVIAEVIDAQAKGRPENEDLIADSLALEVKDNAANVIVGALHKMQGGGAKEAETIIPISEASADLEFHNGDLFKSDDAGKVSAVRERGLLDRMVNVSWMCELIDNWVGAYNRMEQAIRTELTRTEISGRMEALSNMEVSPEDLVAAVGERQNSVFQSWAAMKNHVEEKLAKFGLSPKLVGGFSDLPPVPLDIGRLGKAKIADVQKVLEETGLIPRLWPTGDPVDAAEYAREFYIFNVSNVLPTRFMYRRGGMYPDMARRAYSLDFQRIRGKDTGSTKELRENAYARILQEFGPQKDLGHAIAQEAYSQIVSISAHASALMKFGNNYRRIARRLTTIIKTDGNSLDNLFKHSNTLATLENMQTGGAWQNDDMARAIETETPGQLEDRAKKQVRALMNVARFRSVRSVVSPIMLRLTSMLGVTDATSQAMMVGQTGNPFARMVRNIFMSQKGMVEMVGRGFTPDQGGRVLDMLRMDNRINMRGVQGMSTRVEEVGKINRAALKTRNFLSRAFWLDQQHDSLMIMSMMNTQKTFLYWARSGRKFRDMQTSRDYREMAFFRSVVGFMPPQAWDEFVDIASSGHTDPLGAMETTSGTHFGEIYAMLLHTAKLKAGEPTAGTQFIPPPFGVPAAWRGQIKGEAAATATTFTGYITRVFYGQMRSIAKTYRTLADMDPATAGAFGKVAHENPAAATATLYSLILMATMGPSMAMMYFIDYAIKGREYDLKEGEAFWESEDFNRLMSRSLAYSNFLPFITDFLAFATDEQEDDAVEAWWGGRWPGVSVLWELTGGAGATGATLAEMGYNGLVGADNTDAEMELAKAMDGLYRRFAPSPWYVRLAVNNALEETERNAVSALPFSMRYMGDRDI